MVNGVGLEIAPAYHRQVGERQINIDGIEAPPREALRVAGLFAGIGGIEVGLHRAGHQTVFLCENEPTAVDVLQKHYPAVPLVPNVEDVTAAGLPDIDLMAGGFPCQDLSQAGRTEGIGGRRSGLVSHMFRILDELDENGRSPTWLLIENVQNMLRLEQGRAMAYLVGMLRDRGFHWAYRVVDTRAFGLPQRRQRVILLASKTLDPSRVLFADEAGPPREAEPEPENPAGHGFYWTEGVRGLGWAPGAIPTLKGGSTVGIPSAPAVWMPDGRFVTPGIRDAEALQGFDRDWTLVGEPTKGKKSHGPRWKMVGNAVSVPVAAWVGERLKNDGPVLGAKQAYRMGTKWPIAARGYAGDDGIEAFDLSMWPLRKKVVPIARFLREADELSIRAAAGFRERTFRARLNLEREAVRTCLAQLDAYISSGGVDVDELRRIAAEKKAIRDSGASLRGRGRTTIAAETGVSA